MKKFKYNKGIAGIAATIAIALAFIGGVVGLKTVTQNKAVGEGGGTIGVLPYRSKISSNDTTGGFLNGKLVAGANITFTENNDGANETLTIASTGGGGGGTPCTTTALSLQYNAAGSFGCVSGVTSNGSTLTAKDANFEIVDDGDVTKKLALQASTIGTGTTRTVTALNASGVWALTNAALTTANWVPYTNSSGVLLGSNGFQYDPSTFTAQVGANGTGTGVLNLVKSDGTLNVNLTSNEANDSYIVSDLALGQTSAASRLEIASGTTSKAPLILNSGTNLTSPASGAIENNGTNLFYTDSTPTRRTLVTTDNTQTLTNKSIVATQLTGTLQAAQFPALTGDVTTSAGSLATTIGNDKVLEPMLKAVDSPADEECLTYESTGGDFEWQTCGGGGGGSPGGSGSELQFRGGASTFSAVSGSSVTADGDITLAPTASTSGSPTLLTLTAPAHTTLAASTEASDALFDFGRTVQFATGALTKQTAVRILAPTYSFVGASTLSDAATLYIDNAPGTGTNATITHKYAIWADAGRARFDEEILGGNGASSLPTFSFVSDTGTGFYRVAAGRLGTAISGTGQIDISSTYIGGFGSNDFQIRHSNGLSSTVPTYGFFTSTTSGMSMSAANTLNLITNSVTAIEMGSTQLVGFGVSGATARIHITGSTTTAASLRIAAGTAPTSPNEGDMWADSTQKGLVMFTNGVKQVSSGVTFTQTANATVTTTTTETTLLGSGVGTLTLPANFWVAGKTIRIKVTYSDIDTDATPGTWTIRAKYGTTTIVSHAGTPTASQSNGTGDTEIILTCRTAGASGTIAGYIKTNYGYTGVSTFIGTTTSTTTVDTTASGALNVTMQFGNANAGNNIVSTISTVEVLN